MHVTLHLAARQGVPRTPGATPGALSGELCCSISCYRFRNRLRVWASCAHTHSFMDARPPPRAAPLEQHTAVPAPAEAASSKITPRHPGKSSDSKPPRPRPPQPRGNAIQQPAANRSGPSTPPTVNGPKASPRSTKSTPSPRPRSANSSVPGRSPGSAPPGSSSAGARRGSAGAPRAAQPGSSRASALRSGAPGMSRTELARSAANQRVESRVRTQRHVDAALSPPCRRVTGGDDAPRLGGVGGPRAISCAISCALPAACYASAAPTLSPAVRYAFPAAASSAGASEAGGSTFLNSAMAAAAAGVGVGAGGAAAAVGSCQRGGHFDRGYTTEVPASSAHREAMRHLMAVPAPLAASLCAAAGGAASPRRAPPEADCGGRGSSAELKGEHTKDKPERLTARGERSSPLDHHHHHPPSRTPPTPPLAHPPLAHTPLACPPSDPPLHRLLGQLRYQPRLAPAPSRAAAAAAAAAADCGARGVRCRWRQDERGGGLAAARASW